MGGKWMLGLCNERCARLKPSPMHPSPYKIIPDGSLSTVIASAAKQSSFR